MAEKSRPIRVLVRIHSGATLHNIGRDDAKTRLHYRGAECLTLTMKLSKSVSQLENADPAFFAKQISSLCPPVQCMTF